jgi:predicted dehydrogenase
MAIPRLAFLSATGTARKRTIPVIRKSGICEIVAIHGRDTGKLAALSAEYTIPQYFVNTEVLLDEVNPDFVYIGSPPNLHFEQLKLCLDRRIPVLCEKPLCFSTKEAKAILRMTEVAGVPVRVAHHLRHQAAIHQIKTIIADKSLGEPRRVCLQWGFWLNDTAPNALWKLDPTTGGPDAFCDAGIHAIDLLLYLLQPPKQVTALAMKARFNRTFDNVAALISCGSALAEVSTSQAMSQPFNSLEIDFDKGSLRSTHALGEQSISTLEVASSTGVRTITFPQANPYLEEVRDFVALLDGRPNCGTTISEAVQSLQVLEAITESYSTGRTQFLGE